MSFPTSNIQIVLFGNFNALSVSGSAIFFCDWFTKKSNNSKQVERTGFL